MKRKNPSYKNQCDNKLKIYSESPFNTSQYYRILNNAKPRYMNDYYKAPKYNNKRDDKNFNGILNKYYNDYNKIKNKYNVIEDEPVEKEYINYNRFDYNEYENRKKNINYLFFSYDSPEIDENTFDTTDALVNEMYNGNEDTLLKNTQINNDYNKRLEEENELEVPSNQPTLSTHSKKGNYVKEKLDDENENKYEPDDDKNKKEDEEKISSNEPNLKNKQNNNDIINEEKENENDNEFDILPEDNKEKEDNENILMFENNQNNDDELMMFEDIISNNFSKNYNPPYYKIPEYISKEIEKENEEKIEKEEEYEKYKDNNIVNKDKDGNIQKLENIIKEDNMNPQLDQIIDPYDKNKYPPQNNPQKEEKEEEKEKEKEKEKEEYLEYDGEFEAVDDEEIKRNNVEKIINNEGEDKGKKEEEKEKENNGNGKLLKRSVKYREERFESIPVDDLDDEIDYGGFD
jgi:hypothetical protein